MSAWRRRATLALLLAVGACVTRHVPQEYPIPVIVMPPSAAKDSARTRAGEDVPTDAAPRPRTEGARDVRVALATAAQGAVLSATGAWRLSDSRNSVLVRGRAGDDWSIERRGRQLRAKENGGGATPWRDDMLTLRPARDDAFARFAGRSYRGAIRVVASDSGLVIVNVLPMEDYLRGVVPLEIGGPRAGNEQAAVEAQAIAARSYAVVRLAAIDGSAARNVNYDMLSSVADQVYGKFSQGPASKFGNEGRGKEGWNDRVGNVLRRICRIIGPY